MIDRTGANRRQVLSVLAAAGAMLAAGNRARAQTAEKKQWRVAFANGSDEIPFALSVARGTKAAAAKRPHLQMTWFDNHLDRARTLEIARIVAAGGYDLFIEYSALGSNEPVAAITKEAKLKTLAIQHQIPGFPLYVVDNVRAGEEAGGFLAKAAKERWGAVTPVPVIIGWPELGEMFLDRSLGARNAIAKVYPGATPVEFSSKNDAGSTRQLVFDTLTRFPNQKLIIWVHVDTMALAALAAVRNAEREQDVLIAATGGDSGAFPEIRNPASPLIGTYSFFPELWGDDLLDLAEKMLKGEPVPEKIYPTKGAMLTSANISQYYPQ